MSNFLARRSVRLTVTCAQNGYVVSDEDTGAQAILRPNSVRTRQPSIWVATNQGELGRLIADMIAPPARASQPAAEPDELNLADLEGRN